MVDLVLTGVVLVFVGVIVMSVALLDRARKGGAEVKGGGVVMIGPIPIIFGSDAKWTSVAIVLALVLVLVTLLLYMV